MENNFNRNEEVISEIQEASPKAKKAKYVFTTAQTIVSIVLAVIVGCALMLTVICVSKDINPVSYIAGEANKNKLVNKWQSQDTPGLSAYEFFEDGTYKSYISTFSFKGNYTVEGNILTLFNPDTNQKVVYKYSIFKDTLSLTLNSENGTNFEDKEAVKYDKIDSFNQKSFKDLLDEAAANAEKKTDSENQTADNE